MTGPVVVRQVGPGDLVTSGLAELLVDCVEGGASVGFLLPFGHDRAMTFWADALERAGRGERMVLDTASRDAERLYGRLGWQRVGAIPGYGLTPAGALEGTTVFYKDLTG